ncbi:Short chain dehydrogenase-like protein 66 [Elsinoe fawcettii]|nr:Short chain dehydrogenase-like protein 66 [Elsinoe fawcettii]
MSKFTFLVTGASSGFGAQIAIAALRNGYHAVAAARGRWVVLDVNNRNVQDTVEEAARTHEVNVLVNNAGYALRGVVEDVSMTQVREQMETNFFGLLAATKGVLPSFRQRRNGTIVNISSTAGLSGNAVMGLYSASRHAVEGLSEALAAEMQPFDVRVLLVEPGGFRTNFQAADTRAAGRDGGEFVSRPYQGTVAEQNAKRLVQGHMKQPGDPVKAAQAIVDVVTKQSEGRSITGLRLPLGQDAIARAEGKVQSLTDDLEKARRIAMSTAAD